MAKKPNYHPIGRKGTTREPITKSMGPGEPLVIHVCMKGKGEPGETNPDEDDMEHEMNESEEEREMEGDKMKGKKFKIEKEDEEED